MNQESSTRTHKIVDSRFSEHLQMFFQQQYSIHQFEEIVFWISSPDIIEKHHGVIGLRNLQIKESLNQQLRQMGVVDILLNYMKQFQYPQLQLEAAWIIANIAGGSAEDCKYLVDANIVTFISELIPIAELYILEEVVRVLTNIAVDSSRYCNLMVNCSVPELIIDSIQKHPNFSWYINACATFLHSVCPREPQMSTSKILNCIDTICQLITAKRITTDTLIFCLWTLSNHSNNKKVQQFIIEKGVLSVLFDCLKQEKLNIPSLIVFGNICIGPVGRVQLILNMGMMQTLEHLIFSSLSYIRQLICWFLSNICTEAVGVSQFMKYPDLLDHLLILLSHDSIKVKQQIAYILRNVTSISKYRHLILTVFKKKQIISILLDQLEGNNSQLESAVMKCLMNLLNMTQMLEEIGDNYMTAQEKNIGVERLLKITKKSDTRRVTLAMSLGERHFKIDRQQLGTVNDDNEIDY